MYFCSACYAVSCKKRFSKNECYVSKYSDKKLLEKQRKLTNCDPSSFHLLKILILSQLKRSLLRKVTKEMHDKDRKDEIHEAI